jgi:PGF-CTERM protein
MDDPMELPEGYMLAAPEIDLQGDKVWLKLYKDGECIDDSVILGGDTYVYEDEDDVLLFSAQIESVFRGTESNMVVVKYVFMRSDTILDIDGGDTFGVMEVKGTSGIIVLKNDETITLDSDSEVEIMDGLYFKVADNSTTLRYYLAKTISLECPECPECPEPEPCPEVETPNATAADVDIVPPEIVEATPDAKPDKTPDPTPTKGTLPGFEAVFAVAGLLAVAYLVLRQRE